VEAMRLVRLALLVVLSAVVVTFSVIDIDGDPMTSNLPSIVLNCSVDVDAELRAGRSDTPLEDSSPAVLRVRVRRRLHRWLSHRKKELHLRAHFIRGP
jgi:hypothetical protein